MKMLQFLTVCVVSALVMSSRIYAEDAALAEPAIATTATSTDAVASTAIASMPAVPPVIAPQAGAAEEPVEINYIEADIQNVLQTLAIRADVNLILGEEVTGKVTVNLKGVSYEEAMRLIAESKGFAYVKDKNVVKVKSRESLDTEPVELRVVTLGYAKAEDIKKTLDSVLTKQGRMEIDARSNSLVLSDTPSNLARLIPLIQSLDTQTPQVMIEAKFVETTKNPKKDLGINWSGTLLNHEAQLRRPDPTKPIASKGTAAPNPSPLEFSKSLAGGGWSLPTAILDAGEAKIAFSYLNQDTDTELLANPRVVTTDNNKARISIATQYPIPNFGFSEQTASLQINGFTYKDIGIILNVLPRINKDNFVTLEVNPEVSSSSANATLQSGGGSAVQIPIIDTRTATTTVLIKSGNTLAIGGLMREDTSDKYTKVPLMGDVPLLGMLFRSKSLSKNKRDLLIFLTPTIVRPESQTGYEQDVNGLLEEGVYANDKWMPKDNAKQRSFFKSGAKGLEQNSQPKPVQQNFGPK